MHPVIFGTEGVSECQMRTSADPETGRAARTAGGSPAAAVPTQEA
jgi:hypothetical protein